VQPVDVHAKTQLSFLSHINEYNDNFHSQQTLTPHPYLHSKLDSYHNDIETIDKRMTRRRT